MKIELLAMKKFFKKILDNFEKFKSRISNELDNLRLKYLDLEDENVRLAIGYLEQGNMYECGCRLKIIRKFWRNNYFSNFLYILYLIITAKEEELSRFKSNLTKEDYLDERGEFLLKADAATHNKLRNIFLERFEIAAVTDYIDSNI